MSIFHSFVKVFILIAILNTSKCEAKEITVVDMSTEYRNKSLEKPVVTSIEKFIGDHEKKDDNVTFLIKVPESFSGENSKDIPKIIRKTTKRNAPNIFVIADRFVHYEDKKPRNMAIHILKSSSPKEISTKQILLGENSKDIPKIISKTTKGNAPNLFVITDRFVHYEDKKTRNMAIHILESKRNFNETDPPVFIRYRPSEFVNDLEEVIKSFDKKWKENPSNILLKQIVVVPSEPITLSKINGIIKSQNDVIAKYPSVYSMKMLPIKIENETLIKEIRYELKIGQTPQKFDGETNITVKKTPKFTKSSEKVPVPELKRETTTLPQSSEVKSVNATKPNSETLISSPTVSKPLSSENRTQKENQQSTSGTHKPAPIAAQPSNSVVAPLVKNEGPLVKIQQSTSKTTGVHVKADIVPNDKGDYGNVSPRKKSQKRVVCRHYDWVIHGYKPTKFIPGEDTVASGEISNLGNGGKMCLDSPSRESDLYKPVGLHPCHRKGGNQFWMYSKYGEIRRDEACLDFSSKFGLILYPCHGVKGNQCWEYDPDSKLLHHGGSSLCLAINDAKTKFLMEQCNEKMENQKWSLENYDPKIL